MPTLGETVVEKFNNFRKFIFEHPQFHTILNQYKEKSNFLVNHLVESYLDYYMTNEFTSQEILDMFQEGLRRPETILVEVQSSKGKQSVCLKEDFRVDMKNMGAQDRDVTKLELYFKFFYDMYLKNLRLEGSG